MNLADPIARAILRDAMVVRIATLSRNGRPSVTPIYFIVQQGHIWIGTVEWTLAARSARADPRVGLLFNSDRAPQTHQTLRIAGTAVVRTDPALVRRYHLGAALKYIFTPVGLRSYATHAHQLPLLHRYHIQDDAKGGSCVIDVTPEHVDVLVDGSER